VAPRSASLPPSRRRTDLARTSPSPGRPLGPSPPCGPLYLMKRWARSSRRRRS